MALSGTDSGVGLTAMSQTSQLKLDRVQNGDMSITLETTTDIPAETKWFMLDLLLMQSRKRVEQLKA